MDKLDNKVAIVTGAGRGVGRGIALAFAKEGAKVVVVARTLEDVEKVAQTVEGFGGEALALKCDVRLKDDVDRVVAATIEKFGQIDILVNNAHSFGGTFTIEHFGGPGLEEGTDEDWDLCLKSGLMGTFYFMKACFPHMKEKGGKIINCGSAAGNQRRSGYTTYAATKEAIRALTGVAARDWGKYGINVNAFCPVADSPIAVEGIFSKPDLLELFLQNIPLGRIGDCEKDVGRAVVFLASSDSDYITGQCLNIDGGMDIHA